MAFSTQWSQAISYHERHCVVSQVVVLPLLALPPCGMNVYIVITSTELWALSQLQALNLIIIKTIFSERWYRGCTLKKKKVTLCAGKHRDRTEGYTFNLFMTGPLPSFEGSDGKPSKDIWRRTVRPDVAWEEQRRGSVSTCQQHVRPVEDNSTVRNGALSQVLPNICYLSIK